jgi:hypothetical protein
MPVKILGISNPMIGEASLPNFLATELTAEGIRVPTPNELNGALQRDPIGGCQQQVNMLGHQNKSVELKSSLPSVAV